MSASRAKGDSPGKGHVIPSGATVADAVGVLGRCSHAWLALVDSEGRVLSVVSGEEVRLGLTRDVRLHHPLSRLAVPLEGQVPVDREGKALPHAPPPPPRLRTALLMAGGRGKRLQPLTLDCPKPLLPLRGRPVLHHLLDKVREAGIRKCFVSIQYLGKLIKDSVGDGSAFGLEIAFLEEERPLGTAGALGMLPPLEETLLVMNGDIWTEVHLPSFFAWHARNRNPATIGTALFEVHVPYGLAHFEGQELDRLEEKPTLRLPVNAGLYLFEPGLLDQVPGNRPFDMVSWLNRLSREGKVGHFPIVETWHDMGSREEYEKLSGEE